MSLEPNDAASPTNGETNFQPHASNKTQDSTILKKNKAKQQPVVLGRFFSVCLLGSLEAGYFDSVNDVYVKYSIVAGPDWILSSGTDVGITQIARYRLDGKSEARKFVWNQPIAISYRSYNYYGWPQVVVSVYNFDLFGNDQILGYGCIHLPLTNQGISANHKQIVSVYSPQSSSYIRQILSWVTGRRYCYVESESVQNTHQDQLIGSSSRSSSNYIDLLKSNLESLFRSLNIIRDSTQGVQGASLGGNYGSISKTFSLHKNLIDYSRKRPAHIFIISQLVLCTIALSYFIYKDLKDIMNYLRFRVLKRKQN